MSEFTRNKQVIEDKPEFRHVMIKEPAVAPMPFGSPIAIKRTPTLKTFQQPPALTSSGWPLRSLENLPPIYFLDKAHVYVDDNAEDVAGRIAECLRKESVATFFHRDENLADAETSDRVQFSIRLWKGNEGNVLVEVQKTAGCSYSYCRSSRAILRAAKGITCVPEERKYPVPVCVPKVSPEENQVAAKEDLEVAEQLFGNRRLDSQQLAVENLMLMSKSDENKSATAMSILNGGCAERLFLLIESYNYENTTDEMDKEHLTITRRYALATLANCLATLESTGELSSVLENSKDLISKKVLTCLVADVAAAAERPHEACQAAHCLRSLLSSSEKLKRMATGLNAYETISQARNIGLCRHAALEDACTKLHMLM